MGGFRYSACKQREGDAAMSTRLLMSIGGCCLAALVAMLPVAAQNAPAPEAAPPAESAEQATPEAAGQGAGVSQAEEVFRRGVALYKRDLYREALTEFNRAL